MVLFLSKQAIKVIILCITVIPATGFALEGIGALAENLMEPLSIVSDFLNSASLIMGICCLFAGFLKYKQYRVNPYANPISKVIWLLIMGIVLVCLPLLYKLTESGIPSRIF